MYYYTVYPEGKEKGIRVFSNGDTFMLTKSYYNNNLTKIKSIKGFVHNWQGSPTCVPGINLGPNDLHVSQKFYITNVTGSIIGAIDTKNLGNNSRISGYRLLLIEKNR